MSVKIEPSSVYASLRQLHGVAESTRRKLALLSEQTEAVKGVIASIDRLSTDLYSAEVEVEWLTGFKGNYHKKNED